MRSNASVGRRSFLTCVGIAATIWLHGDPRSERGASEPDGSSLPRGNPPVAFDGRFPATVDRIVDDTHVVLLVASRGEVVAQYDVARNALPTAREGDRVLATVTDTELTAIRTEAGTRRDIVRVEPTATAW